MKTTITRIICTLMIAITAICSFGIQPAYAAETKMYDSIPVTRLYGQNRYGTAVDISKKIGEICNERKEKVGYSEIVVANGENFPDALAAASFAARHDAPLFLTKADSLPGDVKAEIFGKKISKAYIIGGEYVITPAVESQLKAYVTETVRLAGQDRYGTCLAIAKAHNYKGNDLFIASGEGFADALSLSAVAGAYDIPVIFVPRTGEISKELADYIRSYNIDYVTIAGGPAAISENLDKKLKNEFGLEDITRLYGTTRYDTANEILKYFTTRVFAYEKGTGVTIASGENFPDALTGSVCAALNGYPLLLVSNRDSDAKYNQVTADTLKWFCPNEICIFGGPYAVMEKTVVKLLKDISKNQEEPSAPEDEPDEPDTSSTEETEPTTEPTTQPTTTPTEKPKMYVTANVDAPVYSDHNYISQDVTKASTINKKNQIGNAVPNAKYGVFADPDCKNYLMYMTTDENGTRSTTLDLSTLVKAVSAGTMYTAAINGTALSTKLNPGELYAVKQAYSNATYGDWYCVYTDDGNMGTSHGAAWVKASDVVPAGTSGTAGTKSAGAFKFSSGEIVVYADAAGTIITKSLSMSRTI